MIVSVEDLGGLSRKIIISVPSDKIEEEVNIRLQRKKSQSTIQGFRPGKAPLNLVKQRYSDAFREQVVGELIRSTLYDALKEKDLVPAGHPNIEPGDLVANQDFTYAAIFEVFPAFDIQELDKKHEVTLISADVSEKDVDQLIEKLREQKKEWTPVTRKVKMGDKVIFDFEGFMDDKPMDHAKESNYELVLGSGQMIDGFESGLVGAEIDKPFDLKVTFPENYQEKTLAGKPAVFKILVKNVFEGQLPELNDAFVQAFNIKEGGLEALRNDIRQNMARELERRVNARNRESIFDALLSVNTFDIPNALVEREIAQLKHELFHRIYGPKHSDNEKIPDFPRELFEEQAVKRVRLGLLFADYVKKHEFKVESDRVDAMIEKLATAYDNPEELKSWYHQSNERLAEVESLVLEQMVADKIVESAKVIQKQSSYDEVMHPSQAETKDEANKGE